MMRRNNKHEVEIRALVYHFKNVSDSKEQVQEKISRLIELKEKFEDATSIPVRSTRIVLPTVSPKVLGGVLKIYHELAEEYGVDYVAVPHRPPPDPGDLVELFETYPRFFTSTLFSREKTEILVKTLYSISGASWIYGARYAIAFKEILQTPYFPATASHEEGFTISLLYTELLKNNIDAPGRVKKKLAEIIENAEKIFPKFLGADYSLSPWMENSVAALIEKKSGKMFTLPGTISSIIQTNWMIRDFAKNKGLGYNEIMLPLGEDNRLKELALTSQLRFSHLLSYTAFCVAGLDMVPIPDTTEPEIVKNILLDLDHISAQKNRPLGLRLILPSAEDGTEITLGFFGKIPVLNPLL